MAAYPDVIAVIPATLPIEHATSQAVLSTTFENGVETRRLLWDTVRRNVTINYSVMEFIKANQLRRFFEAQKGTFESFSFFFPQTEDYVGELVGVEPETPLTAFRLPSLTATSFTLYRNGASLVEGGGNDWLFTTGTPPDIADLATLLITPAGGDIYTFDFTGRLVIKARFADAPIVFSDAKKYWSTTVVNLKGLEPELV